jgi:hypothetical protein
MAYEPKPNTFSLFRDSDERIEERKNFYREKGWDEASVPIYSGSFLLDTGETLGIEAKVIDGAKGKFFSGRAWKKKASAAPVQNSVQVDLDDDCPF